LASEDISKLIAPDEPEGYVRANIGGRSPNVMVYAILVVAALFSLFHIVNSVRPGLMPLDLLRAVHLSFALALAFLMFPLRQGWKHGRIRFFDGFLSLLGVAVGLYTVFGYEALATKAAVGYDLIDYVISGIGIVLVLEATRRAMSPALAIVAVVFLIYAKFGNFIPGGMGHPDLSWPAILEHQFMTKEGIFGIPLTVSAQFVVLFVIFGAFFEKTGAGKFFIDFAMSITGRATGGPAKGAVIASALFGTISGSSVANVVTVGVFTIPLMKKAGYKPEFAGAVEPAASTGGQIMPPVMGAAAFVMAEFLGIPYASIAIAAAIPAVLYFGGVFIAADLEARKQGLRGLSAEECPKFKRTFKDGWFYFLPLVLIVLLLVMGYTPMLAVIYAIFLVILIYLYTTVREYFSKEASARNAKKMGRQIWDTMLASLEDGGKGVVPVAMACACAGIIVGVVTQTGLGFKFGNFALSVSGGNLFPILILTMLTSLVLGMGIPTTANYIITATITAPAILGIMASDAGITVRDFIIQHPETALSAHMFAFYFGVAADLTPPVALAAYAGAAIAKSEPMKTALNAFLIGIGKYMVPYLFIYYPVLLLIGVDSLQGVGLLLLMLVFTVGAMYSINAGTIGYLFGRTPFYLRIAYVIAGLAMVAPPIPAKIAGLGAFLIFAAWQWWNQRRNQRKAAKPD
jgi:TRAP transporter 4TM/12TM fusion protein